jgi:RimJ/RimL family protein N-acetyltransferase
MADAEGSRFIGGPQVRAIAWRGFMSIAGAWAMTGASMFSVIEKSSGAWIGRIGPWVPEGWPGNEVGWSLIRSAWGQGYAVEAATATIDWVFDQRGWDEVIHTIAPDNAASQKVAIRLGSVNRGPGRLPPPNEEHAVEIWGQTRAEWWARRR